MTEPLGAGAGTLSVFTAWWSGSTKEWRACHLSHIHSTWWDIVTLRCSPSKSPSALAAILKENKLGPALWKDPSIVPQDANAASLTAEAVVAAVGAAVAGPERTAAAGTHGGMAAPGSGRLRATTSQAAGDGGRAGLRTLLVTKAELQGPSGVSVPSQGGVSVVSRSTRFPS